MNRISPCILLFLLLFSSLVVATNFTQCLEDIKNNPNAVGAIDSWGYPTSPAAAVGFTYKYCMEQCGSSPVPFSWKDFSQLFSAWILPWLALITQLPFGSRTHLDDFVSIVMSVGSPALAAYSLVLTALNNRTVYRRVHRIKHIGDKNKAAIAKSLIPLQQIPLELTKKEVLLASISINNQWGQEIVGRVNPRDTWSIATASAVVWVIIAFLLTLIDSFMSLNNPANTLNNATAGQSAGHAISTLWLWLLCLVIGWLWVPTFTCRELKFALHHANKRAAKEAAKRIRQAGQGTNQGVNFANAKVTERPLGEAEVLRRSGEPTIEAVEEDQEVEGGSVQEVDKHTGQKTDQEADSLPNVSTSSSQLASEGQRNHGHLGDNENQNSAGGAQDRIDPTTDKLLIPKDDFSYLRRDELRHPATFNYARIFRFLVLVEDVSNMFDELSREDGEETRVPVEDPPFPPGALTSMFNASIFGFLLQVGITGAAVIVMTFNAVNGIGCRCLGYLIYGTNGLIIMYFTVASTILARISETRRESSSTVKDITKSVAIALRRFCFTLAFVNAVGLVVFSGIHFSNILNNCYCNAVVVSRGKGSYIVISYFDRVPAMRRTRIAGTIFAASTMTFYMFSLWLLSDIPPETEDP